MRRKREGSSALEALSKNQRICGNDPEFSLNRPPLRKHTSTNYLLCLRYRFGGENYGVITALLLKQRLKGSVFFSRFPSWISHDYRAYPLTEG